MGWHLPVRLAAAMAATVQRLLTANLAICLVLVGVASEPAHAQQLLKPGEYTTMRQGGSYLTAKTVASDPVGRKLHGVASAEGTSGSPGKNAVNIVSVNGTPGAAGHPGKSVTGTAGKKGKNGKPSVLGRKLLQDNQAALNNVHVTGTPGLPGKSAVNIAPKTGAPGQSAMGAAAGNGGKGKPG